MDLIGERKIKKRKFFSFLISGLSTQIDITSSFITQIIFEKKFPFHFTFNTHTTTSHTSACNLTIETEKLSKPNYDGFSHPLIIEYRTINKYLS